jgi:hypothetical protein
MRGICPRARDETVVTDPVRRIQNRNYDTDLDLHVVDPLKTLASLPASIELPYLTVALDWSPNLDDPGRLPAEELRASERRNRTERDSTMRRPSRTWFDQQAKQILDSLDPRSNQHALVSASIDRVVAYLDQDLDASARGVYIAAGGSQDVFEALALGVTVDNFIEVGPLPAVDMLAHVAEDYAMYGILACNQQEAELSFVTQGVRDRGVYLESTLFPRAQRQGSISERNYRERAEQRVFHFARAISDELASALRETETEVLVLVGSDVFMNQLLNEFPPSVSELVAGTVPYDLSRNPSATELIEATAPIAAQAERDREAAAVAQLREQLGSGQAVAGTIDVLNALQAHQVAMLVMNEDFKGGGWADLTLPLFGMGPIPDEHPTGGDVANIVVVDLEEEFARLALHTGATLEFIHTQVPVDAAGELTTAGHSGQIPRSEAATALDEVGGVGAILRFSS